MSRHPRRIELESCSNFRDLGGYRTKDNKHVTMYHHIYRSDAIAHLTASDHKVLREKLKIAYVVDLRGEEECAREPYTLSGAKVMHIPMVADKIRALLKTLKVLDKPTVLKLMHDVSCTILEEQADQIRRFFDLLIDEVKGTPLVFHCSAGKDRTGMVASLLLAALDVPQETIVEDYLLTNQYYTLPERTTPCVIEGCTITPDALVELVQANQSVHENALNSVEKKYGSLTAYMEKRLGLTPERLRLLRSYYVRPSSHSNSHSLR